MYLLMMVLDDSTKLNEVLEAWRNAGIAGITILESTGVNRVLMRTQARPMMAGFSQLLGAPPVGHHTLFAIIDSLELAEAAAAAVENILGSLSAPNTGLICALPVARVWGLSKENAGNA